MAEAKHVSRSPGPIRGARDVKVVFAGCWATVGLALGILLVRLNDLPDSVPVFVTPLGLPTMWAPTSVPMVTRIALMGAGQLGAVTGLAHGIGEGRHPGWARLLKLMAIAIAAKTLVESVTLAATGTPWGDMTSPVLNVAIIAIVAAFLLSAGLMWRRGLLRDVPEVKSARIRAAIVFSIAVWLACATLPYWW